MPSLDFLPRQARRRSVLALFTFAQLATAVPDPASRPGAELIAPPTPVVISLGNLSQTWDGSPKVPSVSTSPGGVEVSLTFSGSTTAPSAAGTYTVVASPANPIAFAGSASATFQILRASQTIAFPPPPARPLNEPITLQATASSGLPVTFHYLSGPAQLDGATLTITGVGDIQLEARQAGNANIDHAEAALTLAVDPATLPRIANLSTRATAVGNSATDQRLIIGFVLSHASAQPVLLRAVGPGLAAFNVPNVLADPAIELFDAAGNSLATNDNWANATAVADLAQTLGAFPLETDARDAGLVAHLPAGAYSLHVTGGTGAVIAEIYDGDTVRSQVGNNLVNVSTRGQVAPGTPLIGGLVIDGNGPQSVLIRGVGPTLDTYGVSGALHNPVLTVYDAAQNVVATNINWDTPTTPGAPDAAAVAAAATSAGAFALPASSQDATLLLELAPGSYTVHLTSADSATGIALLEIYELLLP